jgi:hypothetical protein
MAFPAANTINQILLMVILSRSNILKWSWIDHHCLSYGHPTGRVMGVAMNVDHHVILLQQIVE